MAMIERTDEPTPNGGDYSEIIYLNDSGEMVDEEIATRCSIRECKSDGTLVSETWGILN